MLLPLPSLPCWYLCCFLRLDSGLPKLRAPGNLSLPFHALLQLYVVGPLRCAGPPGHAAEHLFSLISTLYLTAQDRGLISQHDLFMLCVWDVEPPWEHQGFKASVPFVRLLKESELYHTRVLGKRSRGDAAQQSCSSFRGD